MSSFGKILLIAIGIFLAVTLIQWLPLIVDILLSKAEDVVNK